MINIAHNILSTEICYASRIFRNLFNFKNFLLTGNVLNSGLNVYRMNCFIILAIVNSLSLWIQPNTFRDLVCDANLGIKYSQEIENQAEHSGSCAKPR